MFVATYKIGLNIHLVVCVYRPNKTRSWNRFVTSSYLKWNPPDKLILRCLQSFDWPSCTLLAALLLGRRQFACMWFELTTLNIVSCLHYWFYWDCVCPVHVHNYVLMCSRVYICMCFARLWKCCCMVLHLKQLTFGRNVFICSLWGLTADVSVERYTICNMRW